MSDKSKRPIRLVTPDPTVENEPLHALLSVPEMETSAMHPLEIHLDRDFLIQSIERCIQAIRDRSTGNTDFEYRRHVNALIQQRAEFLESLRREKDPLVYVALYRPDDELRSDDLTLEGLADQDDDLPF